MLNVPINLFSHNFLVNASDHQNQNARKSIGRWTLTTSYFFSFEIFMTGKIYRFLESDWLPSAKLNRWKEMGSLQIAIADKG